MAINGTMTDQELLDVMRPPGSYLDVGLRAFCAKYVRPGMTIVEVGCFAGASSRIFCVAMRGSGRLCCVDSRLNWWTSDGGISNRAEQLFDAFAGANPIVEKLTMDSGQAAALFEDRSVDLVYIDAEHTYEAVCNDIGWWRDKVKPGGILAGHDYSPDSHPGVVKAVDELVGAVKVFEDCSWAVTVS